MGAMGSETDVLRGCEITRAVRTFRSNDAHTGVCEITGEDHGLERGYVAVRLLLIGSSNRKRTKRNAKKLTMLSGLASVCSAELEHSASLNTS